MSNIGHKGNQPIVHKYRGEELNIKEMLASRVGIIADNDIALFNRLDPFQHMLSGRWKAEHHEGAEMSLGQYAAVSVQHGAVDIHYLLDNGCTTHSHKVVSHIIGNGLKTVANHLHGHSISF